MSTQLGVLLEEILLDLSKKWLFCADGNAWANDDIYGRIIAETRVESANFVPANFSTAELGPKSNRRRGFAR